MLRGMNLCDVYVYLIGYNLNVLTVVDKIHTEGAVVLCFAKRVRL